MKCAIIGSTKIAEVHAKHLIENGIKEITFISEICTLNFQKFTV